MEGIAYKMERLRHRARDWMLAMMLRGHAVRHHPMICLLTQQNQLKTPLTGRASGVLLDGTALANERVLAGSTGRRGRVHAAGSRARAASDGSAEHFDVRLKRRRGDWFANGVVMRVVVVNGQS